MSDVMTSAEAGLFWVWMLLSLFSLVHNHKLMQLLVLSCTNKSQPKKERKKWCMKEV